MTEVPQDNAEGAPEDIERSAGLKSLPFRTYRLRVLGMGLAFLPAAVVLHENGGSWFAWAWIAISGLIWPHVAYQIATRSRDPVRAELRNFIIDSAVAGSWVPLLHFNLLPSAVLLSVVIADKVNTGVRGLWQRSLPGMFIAMAATSLLTGGTLQPVTSMWVIVASLPLMIIHTLAVSSSSYRLVRRVQSQNLLLNKLARLDVLTGLDSRGHWEAQAEALLKRHRHDGVVATLLVLDVDRFKAINDQFGHAGGDDVLRSIGEIMRRCLPVEAHAGRFGGDEFVAAIQADLAAATKAAEQLRVAVEKLNFPRYPRLACTVSIGLASAPEGELQLREWIETADRALYRAKQSGRNRTSGVEPLWAETAMRREPPRRC